MELTSIFFLLIQRFGPSPLHRIYIWTMFLRYLNGVLEIFALCTSDIWTAFLRYLNDVLKIFYRCTWDICLMYLRYLPDVLQLFARCTPDICPVFLRYLTDVLEIFTRCTWDINLWELIPLVLGEPGAKTFPDFSQNIEIIVQSKCQDFVGSHCLQNSADIEKNVFLKALFYFLTLLFQNGFLNKYFFCIFKNFDKYCF